MRFLEPRRRNTQSKSAVYSNKRQDRKTIAPFSQKSLQSKSFCELKKVLLILSCHFERSREISIYKGRNT